MSADPQGGLHVVLTMRGVRESKMRLASALSPDARAELNRWLLDRTLPVVARWLGTMRRCIFVSPCRIALDVAAQAGACVLDEPGGAGGHNHAASVGAAHALSLGARRIMLLPCDLPELSEGALDAFVAHSPSADLTLAPDREGTGTNSVLVAAAPALQFFFGPQSLARYVDWGRSRGWRVAVHAALPLAFDLDTPKDYAEWPSRGEYESRVHGSSGRAVI